MNPNYSLLVDKGKKINLETRKGVSAWGKKDRPLPSKNHPFLRISIFSEGYSDSGMRTCLVGAALGGLQRIQLYRFVPVGRLHVSRHIAGSEPPFDGRVGEDHAVLAGIQIKQFLATVTLLHCGVAVSSVKPASSLGHESALNTLF